MFKVNSKVLERRQWCQRHNSGIFIVNFEHISDLFPVFLFLILKRQMFAGWTHYLNLAYTGRSFDHIACSIWALCPSI